MRIPALPALLAAALLSACQTTTQTDGPSKPPAVADTAKPMTREQASSECWMRYEKGQRSMDLDKRADMVGKCISEKMSGVTPSDAKAEAKPEAKPAAPKPAEAKPAEAKPVETKPAAATPAADKKP